MRRRRHLAKVAAKAARHRRNSHGRLSNRVLAQGTTVHAESISHVAFQHSFGRSVGARAPGLFFANLKRKAEAAGGGIVAIPTFLSRGSRR